MVNNKNGTRRNISDGETTEEDELIKDKYLNKKNKKV